MSRGTSAKHYWKRLGYKRCHYCCCIIKFDTGNMGKSATAEHMVPRSHRGTWDIWNMLMICADCNYDRGNTDFIEYVLQKSLPRSEWLINKYEKALDKYRKSGRKLHVKGC